MGGEVRVCWSCVCALAILPVEQCCTETFFFQIVMHVQANLQHEQAEKYAEKDRKTNDKLQHFEYARQEQRRAAKLAAHERAEHMAQVRHFSCIEDTKNGGCSDVCAQRYEKRKMYGYG